MQGYRTGAMGISGPASRNQNVTVKIPDYLIGAGLAEKTYGKHQPGNSYKAYRL
jgi:hypothetical protein